MKVGSKIVIDASVALKWVLPEEEDALTALRLKEDLLGKDYTFCVPVHFMTEVFNTLVRKTPLTALSALSFFLMAPFQISFLSLEIASLAHDLMKRHTKISFYGAFYHALALHKDAVFITADERYYQTVKKEGSILLLKNYSSSKSR